MGITVDNGNVTFWGRRGGGGGGGGGGGKRTRFITVSVKRVNREEKLTLNKKPTMHRSVLQVDFHCRLN